MYIYIIIRYCCNNLILLWVLKFKIKKSWIYFDKKYDLST